MADSFVQSVIIGVIIILMLYFLPLTLYKELIRKKAIGMGEALLVTTIWIVFLIVACTFIIAKAIQASMMLAFMNVMYFVGFNTFSEFIIWYLSLIYLARKKQNEVDNVLTFSNNPPSVKKNDIIHDRPEPLPAVADEKNASENDLPSSVQTPLDNDKNSAFANKILAERTSEPPKTDTSPQRCYCRQCGKKFSVPNSLFCSYCGTKVLRFERDDNRDL